MGKMGGKRKRVDSAPATTSAATHGGAKKQKKSAPVAKSTASNASSKPQNAVSKTPAGSNWLAMKNKIQQKDRKFSQSTEKKHDLDVHAHKQKVKDLKLAKKKESKTAQWIDNSKIVAMDCEMVGVGLSGRQSVLARCSIVDYEGKVLYDKTVRPVEKVTDFRTHVSGIRSRSLKNAIPFAQCLKEVGKLLQDRIVVGHALKNDFKALMFSPPKHLIRDTAKYRPYMRRKMNGTKLYPKSLKHLSEEVLGLQIQTGEHDSVEDARATLALYKREQFAWEKYLRTTKNPGSLAGIAPALPKSAKTTGAPSTRADGKDDDEGTDSEDDGAFSSSAKMVVPDSKELAITEFAE
ncbi:hypothetical protein Poli38472_008354 [Pythium oligandrum]|uniref:RNA exonuclease 4 n=1 Tax=Pythium oligandrum TaxID=41045 RepID=A0A8K1CNL8_PYTOL|nr:hypothetical protein Poli38472_008354 [Pythium oligandrum]|eukprot:TMW65712.1 hypothetical protein Poli38472_008354 [Pythium oligandrum]